MYDFFNDYLLVFTHLFAYVAGIAVGIAWTWR